MGRNFQFSQVSDLIAAMGHIVLYFPLSLDLWSHQLEFAALRYLMGSSDSGGGADVTNKWGNEAAT